MDRNLEMIEKYIDGDLEGKELLDFEELLATDINVKRDYQLSMEINNSIAEDDVMALRETMNYIYEENKVKRIPGVFKGRKLYYAAASAALLIAAGGLIQRLASPDMANETIYNKYYNPYEVTVTYRSGNEKIDKLLFEAMERYDEKDYHNALAIFEEVLKTKKNDMAVNLYSGISYMEEAEYQKAENAFNRVIKQNDNLFVEQAEWYLAMCYIRTDKEQDAKNMLTKLIEEDSYYKKQAIRVLKDLD